MLLSRARLAVISAVVAGVVAVSACSGGQGTTTVSPTPTLPPGSTKTTKAIATGTIVLRPGEARTIGFYVDFATYRPRVTGSFHASGGANDIEVFIASDEDYNSWNIGLKITPIYNSGVVNSADVSVKLPTTGHFYLVINNKYSNAQKTVDVDLYAEWWVAPPST